MNQQVRINKLIKLIQAHSKLALARTLLNSALAEIIGSDPNYSIEYLGVQASFDRWWDTAQMKRLQLEKEILENSTNE